MSSAIHKGQAINLAVQASTSEGKPNDTNNILKHYYYYLKLAAIIQARDPKELTTIAGNPAIIDHFDKIEALLK